MNGNTPQPDTGQKNQPQAFSGFDDATRTYELPPQGSAALKLINMTETARDGRDNSSYMEVSFHFAVNLGTHPNGAPVVQSNGQPYEIRCTAPKSLSRAKQTKLHKLMISLTRNPRLTIEDIQELGRTWQQSLKDKWFWGEIEHRARQNGDGFYAVVEKPVPYRKDLPIGLLEQSTDTPPTAAPTPVPTAAPQPNANQLAMDMQAGRPAVQAAPPTAAAPPVPAPAPVPVSAPAPAPPTPQPVVQAAVAVPAAAVPAAAVPTAAPPPVSIPTAQPGDLPAEWQIQPAAPNAGDGGNWQEYAPDNTPPGEPPF